MLKLLLTSDWRLGRTFHRFEAEAQARLSLARLKTVERVLTEGEKAKVEVVVCAGDLFDSPGPSKALRDAVSSLFGATKLQVLVVPGDRDALVAGSVWRAFAKDAPSNVTVVTGDGQSVTLSDGTALVAAPCHQHVEALEPLERLPGGTGRRIGVAHVGARASAAPKREDFTALLLGGSDTLRFVSADKRAVFAGSPEPMDFEVADCGRVALVSVNDAGQVVVEPREVATLTWEVVRVDSLASLRHLVGRRDLTSRVVRVELKAAVPLADVVAFERELAQFASNEELVCEVDASGLSLDVKDVSVLDGWPAPLQRAAKELLGQSSDPVARRALAQLAGLVSAT